MVTHDPIIQTQSGAVRGRYEQNIAAFKGIPFAAPPVGKHRFKAPVQPEPWVGVRDTTAFSPTPPHATSSSGIPGLSIAPLAGEGWSTGADYLTLTFSRPDS